MNSHRTCLSILMCFVCVRIKHRPNSRSYYFASLVLHAQSQSAFSLSLSRHQSSTHSSDNHNRLHFSIYVNCKCSAQFHCKLPIVIIRVSLGIIKIYLTVLQLLWALHCFCFASLPSSSRACSVPVSPSLFFCFACKQTQNVNKWSEMESAATMQEAEVEKKHIIITTHVTRMEIIFKCKLFYVTHLAHFRFE